MRHPLFYTRGYILYDDEGTTFQKKSIKTSEPNTDVVFSKLSDSSSFLQFEVINRAQRTKLPILVQVYRCTIQYI